MNTTTTLQTERLLVVINPKNDLSIALERAIITSQLRTIKPIIHLLFIVDEETTEPKHRNETTFIGRAWLRAILSQLEENNLEYTYEFCWTEQWYQAILTSSESFKADIVYIPDYKADSRHILFGNSHWALLRKSKCPVMIVRPGASNHRKKVLAAINIQNEDPDAIVLNEKILTKGKAIAKLYDAEFIIVNSYTDSMHYPNVDRLIKMTGLPSKNVLTSEGEPADVISQTAKLIKADIVIIGTKAKQGTLSLMTGNTSRKVLRKVNQDIITYS